MWTWLKNLFNKLISIFRAFIEAAIPVASKLLIAEFKDFAIDVVEKLTYANFSNEEKRKKAFDEIKKEAITRGKNLGDSLINFLIELAVQYIKNTVQ